MKNTLFLDDETKEKISTVKNRSSEYNACLSDLAEKKIPIVSCTCCKKPITTGSAIFFGYSSNDNVRHLWFNCPDCNSTMIVKVA